MVFSQNGQWFLVKCNMVYYPMYLPPTYSPTYSPNQLITYFPPMDYLRITYLATYIFSPSYNLPTYYIPTYPLTYLPKFTQILTIKFSY